MIRVIIFFLNFFDFFHKRKIKVFLKENKSFDFTIILDVGAHEGESISFFLKNFNVDKIISFEPSPINFEKLKKNIAKLESRFKKTEIIIENLALGKKKETVKLKQHSESSSSTINNFNLKSNYFKKKNKFLNLKNNFFKELDVNVIVFEEYIVKNGIQKIDLLKIDTEGYEYDVLQGLNNKLNRVEMIMFEHHYDDMLKKEYTFSKIHDFLKQNSFKKIFKSKMFFRKTFEYIYENSKFN